jgi:hypothetical protein
MGEYEDRYPEAYGRGEEPLPSEPENRNAALSPEARDRFSLRSRFGLGTAAEPPAAWQHAASEPARLIEPMPQSRGPDGSYRGIGPRGYVRSPRRIYEDVCDRLTDHPLIDASDIEVSISGVEVTLAGSVDNPIAATRAEAIAREVTGVAGVRNALTVRPKASAATR